MEPKFQSSFIPKSSTGLTGSGVPTGQAPRATTVKSGGLVSFVASLLFTLSVILALGMFGYKFFLKYSIAGMEADLQQVYSTLEPETVREIVRLDQRIKNTSGLISKHVVLSPLFTFLEDNTPRDVRFLEFAYNSTDNGHDVSLRGQARSYSAIAQFAEIVRESGHFRNLNFSNLLLDESGRISFLMRGQLDPKLLSYPREVERSFVEPEAEVLPSAINLESGTSTATSTSTN